MACTTLKLVLAKEDINHKELCDVISEIDLMKEPPEPGIMRPVISYIANGIRQNLTITTMNKIVGGINQILENRGFKKRYTLDEIFGTKCQ